MKCVTCKHGEFEPGETTLTFERDESVVVVRNVPARVCDNCGEVVLEEDVAKKAFDMAQSELDKGVEVEITKYAA